MGRRRLRRRGPVVGILAYRHGRQYRMWGEQTSYLTEVLRVAADLGVPTFLFGPQDVDLSRGRVRAWRRRNGRWRSFTAGLPAVVYDRFFMRREPGAGRRLTRYRQLKRSGRLRFMGPDLPNKWRVHKILRRPEDFRPHLPRASLYQNARQLTALLERWQGAVLKPIRGQKGLGIWFIRPLPGRRWAVASGTGASRRLSRPQLQQWCAKHLRAGRYMVQEFLALTDDRGRPRDVRVLVQRDAQGQVVVTGMGTRLGRPGTLVANLHRGGRGVPVGMGVPTVTPPAPELWAAVAGDQGAAAQTAAASVAAVDEGQMIGNEVPLAAVAQRAFALLDEALGAWPELAIDLGVDDGGQIWFIEANSRPGRAIFRRIGDFTGRRRAIQRPLVYARYLMTAAGRA